MSSVDYGIEYIMFGEAPATGVFPEPGATTGVKLVNLIVMDSYVKEEADDEETDIYWEDVDGVGMTLNGNEGAKTVVFESNDLSAEQYNYFKGYITDATTKWTVEDPGFTLPPQYMEMKTRAIDQFKARIHQYTPVKVKVKEAGTTGKNGLPNLTFAIKRQANKDATGKQIGGHRFKDAD
jgi:hypothetical protein